MFGSLKCYEKKEYWETHRWIHFYMPENLCLYEAFAVFRTTVSEPETVFEQETATGADADANAGGQGENFPYYRYAGNLNQEQFQNLIREVREHACYDTGDRARVRRPDFDAFYLQLPRKKRESCCRGQERSGENDL